MRIKKVSQYIEGGLSISDIYPVGSIYMSVNNTNPSTLFGGTWEQLKDTFLLSAGDTYTAGDTGGNATHRHKLPIIQHNAGGTATSNFGLITTGSEITGDVYKAGSGNIGISTLRTDGTTYNKASYEYQYSSMTESNMPPYLAVYMWKRTA